MERNYTAAVRAINADSRKRHRSQLEVVIPCPPPKPSGGSEDFISLNFESENEDDDDDDDDDDSDGDGDDKEGSSGCPPSEDLKTTQTSMSEENKENESEDGISEKTRSKRRRKDRSDRKDSIAGERGVGEEAMKAVAKSEELVAAAQGIGKSVAAVTIEIKSSPSSSSGGAYQHEADEDKDSTTRKAQQQQQRRQGLKSPAAPFSSCSAITATSPLSFSSSAQTRAADTNTSEISSSSDSKSQSVAKGTTADILQGGNDLTPKALRKLAKNQKRRERRRLGLINYKATLEQKKASRDHPHGASFSSVPSGVGEAEEERKEESKGEGETNESGGEGLEINLVQEEERQVEAKEEEEEEDYISLSISKAPVFAASGPGIPPQNSSGLSSPLSPSPTPAPYNKSGNSGRQEQRQSPILIDRRTVMFQMRYCSASTPPPFIHEESRPLFASTSGVTTASFRVDTKRFEELEDAGKGAAMGTIMCDVCLRVGHAGWTCRLLKCEHCGAWDNHPSNSCPELPASEVSLKDYNWRKFPQATPPPSPPATTTTAQTSTPLRPVKANCYHCSGTEHFGDDCPFLPPLSHPGIFSLSGINDGSYAPQEWLCQKQDLLAELEGKKKKPAYGRAMRPGDYDASEEFEPFGEYRALEREKDSDRRRATGGGGEMIVGRRRPRERSPLPRRPHHRSEYSEFDRYKDGDRDRARERNRGRDWCDRRSKSPPVRGTTGTYYSSSTTSGPSARHVDRGGQYSRVPPPPSLPPPLSPPPPPSTNAHYPMPLRPPVTQSQARRGSAGRGGNSTGIGRGGGGAGRGSPSSSSSRKRGRGPK